MPDLRRFRIALVPGLALLPSAALAGGAVATTEEVTLRLVAEAPRADGTFRAALVLDLAPGWKTYWRDPGDAGLPPRIELTGDGIEATLEIHYPAPVRFEEAGARSNGYVAPVGFGVTGRLVDPLRTSTLHADVAIGVCREVCIPVTATLALDLPTGGANDPDTLVDWTFAGLPREDGDGFRARLSADRGILNVNAANSATATQPDLFAAGPEGWSFGPAQQRPDGSFDLPVLSRPRGEAPSLAAVDLVIVDGETTVEGRQVPVDIR